MKQHFPLIKVNSLCIKNKLFGLPLGYILGNKGYLSSLSFWEERNLDIDVDDDRQKLIRFIEELALNVGDLTMLDQSSCEKFSMEETCNNALNWLKNKQNKTFMKDNCGGWLPYVFYKHATDTMLTKSFPNVLFYEQQHPAGLTDKILHRLISCSEIRGKGSIYIPSFSYTELQEIFTGELPFINFTGDHFHPFLRKVGNSVLPLCGESMWQLDDAIDRAAEALSNESSIEILCKEKIELKSPSKISSKDYDVMKQLIHYQQEVEKMQKTLKEKQERIIQLEKDRAEMVDKISELQGKSPISELRKRSRDEDVTDINVTEPIFETKKKKTRFSALFSDNLVSNQDTPVTKHNNN